MLSARVTDTAEEAAAPMPAFAPYEGGHMGLYPCVDSAQWVEDLIKAGVRDIQLRIKVRPLRTSSQSAPSASSLHVPTQMESFIVDLEPTAFTPHPPMPPPLHVQDKPESELDSEVSRAQAACAKSGARLWVNDHWEVALRHRTYGLHLGQEDIAALRGATRDGSSPLMRLQAAGVRLGVSTHSFEELGRALAVRPSYVSLGPIFPTGSKKVAFAPQGLQRIRQWRAVVRQPLVVIGGIGLEEAPRCVEAGAEGVCVISALLNPLKEAKAERDYEATVRTWEKACGRASR